MWHFYYNNEQVGKATHVPRYWRGGVATTMMIGMMLMVMMMLKMLVVLMVMMVMTMTKIMVTTVIVIIVVLQVVMSHRQNVNTGLPLLNAS